jgi:hypothetical protein
MKEDVVKHSTHEKYSIPSPLFLFREGIWFLVLEVE